MTSSGGCSRRDLSAGVGMVCWTFCSCLGGRWRNGCKARQGVGCWIWSIFRLKTRSDSFPRLCCLRYRYPRGQNLVKISFQIRFLMPDRESCIIRFGEKQILVIWWDTGEWSAFIVCRIDRVDCLSERAVVRVKGDTANRVFNLFQPLGQLSGRSCAVI